MMIKNNLILFFTSISLLAIEMVGARLLLPYLGTSIIQWAAIIGVILSCYCVGYLFFKKIVSRGVFYPLILGSIFSLFSFYFLDFCAPKILLFSIFNASVIFAFFLMGLPSILWSTIFPFHLSVTRNEHQRFVLIISTLGNLIGVWGISVFSIPFIGLNNSFLIVALLPAFGSMFFLDRKSLYHWFFVILFLFLVLFIKLTKQNDLNLKNIVFQKTTPYQTFSVVNENDSKSFFIERFRQFNLGVIGFFDDNYFIHSIQTLDLLPKNKRFKVLTVGVGGAYMQHLLEKNYKDQVELIAYELDKEVYLFSKKYFNFNLDATHFKNGDARYLLKKEENIFDLIILDTYVGASIPGHLLTQEYFNELKNKLSSSGIIVMNLFSLYKKNSLYSSLISTISANFSYIYEKEIGYNCLIYFSNARIDSTDLVNVESKRFSANILTDDKNNSDFLVFEIQKDILNLIPLI